MTHESSDDLVFRTVYVDPDVDAALRMQAAEDGLPKGKMFRRYLETGMALAAKGRKRPAVPSAKDTRLCMRTVFLPSAVDAALARRALALKTSKMDLIRQYLKMGMGALGARKAALTLATSTPRGRR